MSARIWDAFVSDADRSRAHRSRDDRPTATDGRATAVLHVGEAADVPDRVRARIAALRRRAAGAGVPVFNVLSAERPSAFFGTSLLPRLVRARITTLVVCGDTVSNRVRATVIDAVSHGFDVLVAEDCVWEPVTASLAVGLFDIDRRYGRVLDSAAITSGWPGPTGGHEHRHDDGPPAVTALPPAVLAALPPGAVPVATAHHPVHGHVLERAGDGVVAAVVEQMAATFGDTPHVAVTLRADDVRGLPDLQTALDQTAGGVLIVGVGYELREQPATLPAAGPSVAAPAADAPIESCPECGASASHVEEAPDDGTGRRVLLSVCGDCGAAWDL